MGQAIGKPINKILKWEASMLNRYGLVGDDILCNERFAVGREALRRLPKHLQERRQQRLWIASDLFMKKTTLPDTDPHMGRDWESVITGRELFRITRQLEQENDDHMYYRRT